MASKSRKRTKKRQQQQAAELYQPKGGPGQVFAKIGDEDGNAAKRLRNMGASALMLAWYRGQLETPAGSASKITGKDRYDCGEIFEKRWALAFASGGRDSTNLDTIRGGTDSFTEARQDAGRALQRWRGRMAPANFRIVCAFCGDGHSMADSLRQAGIEVLDAGRTYRIREALDDLVQALTGLKDDVRNQQVTPVDKPRADA